MSALFEHDCDREKEIALLTAEVADCIRHALVEPKPPYKKRTNRRKKK